MPDKKSDKAADAPIPGDTHPVWFITGSSRGFGRALVTAALAAGDSVVATARRPDQLTEFTSQYGDRVLPVALDVTDPAAVDAALEAAVHRFGLQPLPCHRNRSLRNQAPGG